MRGTDSVIHGGENADIGVDVGLNGGESLLVDWGLRWRSQSIHGFIHCCRNVVRVDRGGGGDNGVSGASSWGGG
jgi:hypothetical protein